MARVCTFLRWYVREGHAAPAMVEELGSRENPLRATPPVYGKLQDNYPPGGSPARRRSERCLAYATPPTWGVETNWRSGSDWRGCRSLRSPTCG
ncbi:MAG: hypothetical protein ACRDX8_09345 [Acidimicrobiales bacterium]